ncbi:hypothetical protein B0I12_002955 [Microbacterium hydrothermale]|uniref:hypothetical protein n=1 Tax=Microbacterium hydrothermale TaxID=857427 RepID=UPI00222721BA|nr:hypothetical protein [Microbacterium hydrothermale]MCW2165790.1 hypothetical protein [Microbacterium hydrothermale]
MEYTLSRYIAQDSEILKNAATTARDITRQLEADLIAARSFRDPGLTDAAQTARREDMERQARENGRARLEQHRASVQRAREFLTKQAKEHTQLPTDPAAMMLATQKWHGIERQLDAGRDLRDVIASTDDVNTILAIKEFAPAYEAAKGYRPPGAGEMVGAALAGQKVEQVSGEWVERATWSRLAQITPDHDTAALLRTAVNVDAHHNAASPWLDAGEGIATGRGADMLGTAIAAQLASAEVTAD